MSEVIDYKKWRAVPISKSRVVIDPPDCVDGIYDDLMLEITGNFMPEDKLKAAEGICDALNAYKPAMITTYQEGK